MGLDDPSLRDEISRSSARRLDSTSPNSPASRSTRDGRRDDTAQRADALSAVRDGELPTPSGKCEFFSPRLARHRTSTRADLHRRRTSSRTRTRLAERYPLTLISSPAHHPLNSFVNIGALRRGAREPECLLHPRRERRGIGRRLRRLASSSVAQARFRPRHGHHAPPSHVVSRAACTHGVVRRFRSLHASRACSRARLEAPFLQEHDPLRAERSIGSLVASVGLSARTPSRPVDDRMTKTLLLNSPSPSTPHAGEAHGPLCAGSPIVVDAERSPPAASRARARRPRQMPGAAHAGDLGDRRHDGLRGHVIDDDEPGARGARRGQRLKTISVSVWKRIGQLDHAERRLTLSRDALRGEHDLRVGRSEMTMSSPISSGPSTAFVPS